MKFLTDKEEKIIFLTTAQLVSKGLNTRTIEVKLTEIFPLSFSFVATQKVDFPILVLRENFSRESRKLF